MNKNITSYNDKGEKHGFWEFYFRNSNRLYFKQYYINDKLSGYDETYLVYYDDVILTFHL